MDHLEGTVKGYDGCYFEVFNDGGKERMLADVEAWLGARLWDELPI